VPVVLDKYMFIPDEIYNNFDVFSSHKQKNCFFFDTKYVL